MSLSSLTLDRPTPLLADRVILSMPSTAFVDRPFTRHGGLMGFERRSPRDHRAGFDLAGAKVRVLAEERFRLDDGRLGEHVRGIAERRASTLLGPARVLELEPGKHYLLLANALPIVMEGAAHFLGQGYLALPDGLVVEISYYVDPLGLAAHGAQEAHQLAIRLARSAVPGPRRYVRGPAGVQLGRRERDAIVEMELVRDWVPTLDLGPDFAAHRFFQAIPYGATGDPSLLVYLGRHPSVDRPPTSKDVDVQMLGRTVAGFVGTEAREGTPLYTIEAFAPVGEGLFCHVRMEGARAAELDGPRAMVATIAEIAASPPTLPEAVTVVKPAGPDFDALCSAAHPDGGTGPQPAMEALWRALFELDAWHFAVAKDGPTTPLVVEMEGKRWAFVFTDPARALRFYEENAGAVGGAHALTLALPLEGARAWIRQAGASGIFGVQFNYAQPGWFSRWDGVDRIWSHLRARPPST